MAEEWGHIVVKASTKAGQKFVEGQIQQGFLQLAADHGIEPDIMAYGTGAMDEVIAHNGYISMEYECADWANLSKALFASDNDLEYYAIHGDEYGTMNFFALSIDGKRVGFQFDQGGDDMDDEEYQATVIDQINNWKTAIPEVVKAAFPEFADIDSETYVF